jgi:SAM-dependent methyltransferase
MQATGARRVRHRDGRPATFSTRRQRMKTVSGKQGLADIGRGVWRKVRAAEHRVADAMDAMFHRYTELPSVRRRGFVVGGDFSAIGNEFLEYLQLYADLQPDERILDVGCGIGRMAIPLLRYLSPQGSYDGLDIVPHGIRWCTTHITSRNPAFRFQLADIHNRDYNPTGRQAAAHYRFPYADESFDVAILTSVFTHMVPAEVANYLAEIRRVLKPGGRCLITWFLLNGESRRLLREGRSALDLRFPIGNCLAADPSVPEKAIGYPEDQVGDLYARAGLVLVRPVYYGAWCGRTTYLSGQDVCIARKPAASSR